MLRSGRRLARRTALRAACLGLLVLLVMVGCGRATDRPLRGAAPGTEVPAPVTAGVPPTLQPSDALRFRTLPSPSPGVSASPSPSASPAPLAPIVRTINPPNGGKLAPGAPVTISATLVGRTADLASTSLTINNADLGAQTDKRTAREWTIHATQALPAGHYTARVLVVDTSGTRGGFTWQFDIAAPDEAPPE
jgi:hypothetical protein